MGCEIFLDKKITKLEQMQEGVEYVFDNEINHLVEIHSNRFTFVTMCGTYVANKAMMEKHIKEGVFTIKNS